MSSRKLSPSVRTISLSNPYNRIVGYTLRHISLGCLLSHEPYSTCTLPTLQKQLVLDYISSSSPFQDGSKKINAKISRKPEENSTHARSSKTKARRRSQFLAHNHSASASKTQSLLAAGAQDHMNKKCGNAAQKKKKTQTFGVPLPIAKQN